MLFIFIAFTAWNILVTGRKTSTMKEYTFNTGAMNEHVIVIAIHVGAQSVDKVHYCHWPFKLKLFKPEKETPP